MMSSEPRIDAIKQKIQAGALTEARNDLLTIIGLDEQNEAALEALAELHERSGDTAAAERQWRRLGRLFPQNKAWFGGVVRMLRAVGRWDEIGQLLADYRASLGEELFYLELESDHLLAMGDTDAAISVNERILARQAENYWANYRLADANLRKGNLDAAKEGFEKAAAIDAAAPFAHERLAFVDLRRGNVAQAISRLSETHARCPDHIWTLDNLLKIHIQQGNYAEAHRLIDEGRGHLNADGQAELDKRIAHLARDEIFHNRILASRDKIESILKGVTLVDVGAADGFQWFWCILARLGFVNAIGFEPDDAECAALNGIFPYARFLPYAVGAQDGPATFNITDVMSCSSLLEPDLEVLKPYPIRSCFEVVKRVPMNVRSLQSILSEVAVNRVDFLKVDVQGAEYQILSGMGDALDGVLAMQLETQTARLYKDQKTLFELVDFLAQRGFRLRGVEPQGTFEGEVLEIEAYFAKDLSTLSDLEKSRVFLWEAIVGCPQLPMMGDNPVIHAYPRLARTLSPAAKKTAEMRRSVRALVSG